MDKENKYFAHESSYVDNNVEIGKGTKIWHFSHIQSGAVIGANATIVCGVTIGEYSMIGSGAVITKDVPPDSLVIGNPGRVIGKVDKKGNKID